MHIHTETNSQKLIIDASMVLNTYFLENSDKPILFMTSGGSALNLLSGIDIANLGSNVTITVLDERYSSDASVNNFAQLMNTDFYQYSKNKGCTFIYTQVQVKSGMTLEQYALNFEKQLRQWKSENPGGKVVITQGLGSDGHTSGIFPYPDDHTLFDSLFNGEEWVTGYDAGSKNQYPQRFTTTMTFLKNEVDASVIYVTGEEKSAVLKEVLSNHKSIYELPATVIHKMKAHTYLFTDISL